VDATIISAPSSTKNKDKARNPEMRQAKKGTQWHFEMKMHIGVDDELGLIHSIVSTPAHIAILPWQSSCSTAMRHRFGVMRDIRESTNAPSIRSARSTGTSRCGQEK
jgi:hypothetical protein